MFICMVCGKESNLGFSLCQVCYSKNIEEKRKKYNWPF